MQHYRISTICLMVISFSVSAVTPLGATSCAGPSDTITTLTGTVVELEQVDLYDSGDDQFRAVIETDEGNTTEFLILGNARAMSVGNRYEVAIHDYPGATAQKFETKLAYLHANDDCSLADTVFAINEGGALKTIDQPMSPITKSAIGIAAALSLGWLIIHQRRSPFSAGRDHGNGS